MGPHTFDKIDTSSATLHRQSYFYIGGQYIFKQNSASISFGQMYVEHLVPIKVTQPFPIIFIPGKGECLLLDFFTTYFFYDFEEWRVPTFWTHLMGD